MKRYRPIEDFGWPITVILALAIGLCGGFQIEKGIADTEIMDIQAQLETANASLAELNLELAFWRDTMTRLANGEQFKGVDIKYGRPSLGD